MWCSHSFLRYMVSLSKELCFVANATNGVVSNVPAKEPCVEKQQAENILLFTYITNTHFLNPLKAMPMS